MMQPVYRPFCLFSPFSIYILHFCFVIPRGVIACVENLFLKTPSVYFFTRSYSYLHFFSPNSSSSHHFYLLCVCVCVCPASDARLSYSRPLRRFRPLTTARLFSTLFIFWQLVLRAAKVHQTPNVMTSNIHLLTSFHSVSTLLRSDRSPFFFFLFFLFELQD
jgi:hypothetical protein